MRFIEVAALGGAGLLCLTWIVYPLLIGLLARFRLRPVGRLPDPPPMVTVVLATREPEAVVRARIDDLLATSYPLDQFEIVVSSDVRAAGSDEGSWPTNVRSARGRVPGKASALNAGVEAARGSILVFADSYQRFETTAIPQLVAALSVDRVGVASGRLELPAHASLVGQYWKVERWLRSQEARLHSAAGATGAIYAIRREVWTPLPEDLLLDDVYVPMHAVLNGWRVGFVDDARAFETRQAPPTREYARKVRTLTGVIQLVVKLPGLLVPLRNPIWLQFTCHKLLRLATPYALAAVALWVAAVTVRELGAWALGGVAVVAALAAWAAQSSSVWGARIRNAMVEGVLMQLAPIKAGINGLRGRWEVWDA